MLDIHIFEPVSVLLGKKLIKQNLLEINPLNIQESNNAIEVALEAHIVICISTLVVHVDLLLDDHLRVAHLGDEIEGNILESKEACKIERSSTLLISFDKELQDVVLAHDKLGVVRWIVLAPLIIEMLDNSRKISLVSVDKDTLTPSECLRLQRNHLVDFLLGAFFVVHLIYYKFEF